MAERVIKKVDSDEVQGAGSFVRMRSIPYGRIKQARQKDAEGADVEAQEAFMQEIIKDAVVEWDWVNDAGEALPIPSGGLNFDELTTDEFSFLVSVITGKRSSKN